MSTPPNETPDTEPPFKPSSEEEAMEAYRLGAELFRAVKKSLEEDPPKETPPSP